jgi:agmatinase
MIKLIGIPFDLNSSFLRGPALAPPRIRLQEKDGSANSFSESCTEIVNGKNYFDLGDMSFDEVKSESVYQSIKKKITDELSNDSKIISFGGDHSVSFPIIEAFSTKYKDLNVLHLDAHPDLYENFENNRYSHASPFARLMERNCIKSLTQVGIRTLNSHQKAQAHKYGVKIIEMKNFNYDFLKDLKAPLYLSLDLDVLDPAFAPGVSHHEPGGMTSRDLLKIVQSLPVPIVGADIVEYNPTRDSNNTTAMVAYKLFKEIVCAMM